jgi:large subunit ribosomal protein L23
MADITDIKAILYTEKSIAQHEDGVVVVQTAKSVSKNQLKEIFREYFGLVPLRINSVRVHPKPKRFRGIAGRRPEVKKFYVKLPEGANLESITA